MTVQMMLRQSWQKRLVQGLYITLIQKVMAPQLKVGLERRAAM